MIAFNKNGGCPEGQTADGQAAVQGRTRTVPESTRAPHAAELDGVLPVDFLIDRVREYDENATDGAHRCEDEPTVWEVWYLNATDTQELMATGRSDKWTITQMCVGCRQAEMFRGATVQSTTFIDRLSRPGNYGMGGHAA